MLNLIFKSHRAALKSGSADPQKIFAMLKVIPQNEVAQARPPLAFALVIDTSGSMREYEGHAHNKLDQAIRAAHSLVDDERLLPTDRVAVVQFDTTAAIILPLTELAHRQHIHQAIEQLRHYSGATYMAKGLSCGADALASLPAQTAKRLLLLTDGAAMDEPQCRQVAGHFAETNTPIVAIGIGEEYHQDLLEELAAVSQGRQYHLRNMAEFQIYLNEEVGSSVREVITDLQAQVATVKGATLDSITRVYPSIAEVPLNTPYRLGNLGAGDFTVFILEITVAGIPRPPSRARVAQLSLTGALPGLGRREELPPQDLFLLFSPDEAALAEVDAEVLGYVQQKNVDRMVHDAVRLATVDPGRARQTLQAAVGMTQRVGNAGMTQMLNNALDELNKTGTLSAGTAKTVRAGGRTKTMKPGGTSAMGGGPSEDEIRRLTGA